MNILKLLLLRMIILRKYFFIKINRLANSIIENKMLLVIIKKWNFYYKKVLKFIKYNNKKYFYKENKNKYVKFII